MKVSGAVSIFKKEHLKSVSGSNRGKHQNVDRSFLSYYRTQLARAGAPFRNAKLADQIAFSRGLTWVLSAHALKNSFANYNEQECRGEAAH
jgi:hypothetical protein